MFKKGQLVRSRLSNLLGVVVNSNKSRFYLEIVNGKHKGKVTDELPQGDHNCVLVGNNFKGNINK